MNRETYVRERVVEEIDHAKTSRRTAWSHRHDSAWEDGYLAALHWVEARFDDKLPEGRS